MKYFAAYALLPSGLERDVVLDVLDGRFASVTPDGSPDGAARLPGVVLPGSANAHSHAFHRALRGRTQSGADNFWTWRDGMYALASSLDPDSYLALARATFAEMVLAGTTTVAEFHYLHHAPGGSRYVDENAMGEALRQAAVDAGIRLTLVDACYLAGGLDASGHRPLEGPQLRFGDGDVERWAARVASLPPSDGMRVGVAAHSVRAVRHDDLAAVAAVAAAVDGRPLHVHLSEQPAENEACLAFYGRTPTELLDDAGFLGPRTTVVHATHLTGSDIASLGGSRVTVCACPTTERDLGDGIGPIRALHDAGCGLALGSDQNAVIDPFEEARALEMDERLAALQRGRLPLASLTAAMTDHAALGWCDAGRLEAGARADLVAVRLDSPRTAGCDPAEVVFAAGAADVDTVLVDGRVAVEGGHHVIGDVGRLLDAAIAPLWRAR
jgi:formiminoglutamate deiminase